MKHPRSSSNHQNFNQILKSSKGNGLTNTKATSSKAASEIIQGTEFVHRKVSNWNQNCKLSAIPTAQISNYKSIITNEDLQQNTKGLKTLSNNSKSYVNKLSSINQPATQYKSPIITKKSSTHSVFQNPTKQIPTPQNIKMTLPLTTPQKLLAPIKTNPKINYSKLEYEELADGLTSTIQSSLISEYNLDEVWIPLGVSYESGPRCNVFLSKNWFASTSKALLLIPGAGSVYAGLWSRSVCINESLNTGSMLPFIESAESEGYEVLIFNPNLCRDPGTGRPIPLNENREAHGRYVWNNFIKKSRAREIYIVAHSCGGASTICLMNEFWNEFRERVRGIAFTDSVHNENGIDAEKKRFLAEVARHWVASRLEGNVEIRKSGVVEVSAGHHRHEYTTGYAFPYIFPYFKSRTRI